MSEKITRRDFLKAAGLGSAASVLLSSCGEAGYARALTEWGNLLTGRNRICLNATCGECPAGCGLLITTTNGKVEKFEGNPNHPVNRGILCGRSQLALLKLNHPSRLRGPLRKTSRGSSDLHPIAWKEGLEVVTKALKQYRPGEITFLLGLFPDHLNDLVQLLSNAIGGYSVLRYCLESELGGEVTLMDATQALFGVSKTPYFDLEHAQVVFSFGADLGEPWISPSVRNKGLIKDAYWVQFGSRLPEGEDKVDEWFQIRLGSEGILAEALSLLVSELEGGTRLNSLAQVSLEQAAVASGVSVNQMKRLAGLFTKASSKIALPGSVPLGSSNGLENAKAILGLNVAADNLGKKGGIFLTSDVPLYPDLCRHPNTIAEVAALVERIRSGQVKVLLIHGVDPISELPKRMGFREAMQKLELVISFSPFLDKTALQANYLLPDHTPLESWGYQRVASSGRLVVSGLRPVVSPLYNTRSTVDVLLEAVKAVGGGLAAALPSKDEEEFLRKSIAGLFGKGSVSQDSKSEKAWEGWLQKGGWWTEASWLAPPVVCGDLGRPHGSFLGRIEKEDDHYLNFILLPEDQAGRKKQLRRLVKRKSGVRINRKKELPQVEMHPEATSRLGLHDGSVVRITSSTGEITAIVKLTDTISADSVVVCWDAMELEYEQNIQVDEYSPLDLIGTAQNQSGGLAYASRRVMVEKV